MIFTATKIHNGIHFLPETTAIEFDENGYLIAFHDDVEALKATQSIQHYEGILCPGFINAHCHVELSHLKDKIAPYQGLPFFLKQVVHLREGFTQQEKNQARHAAVAVMEQEGIVALGDIVNSLDTLNNRIESTLSWHTFVEAIGFQPKNLTQVLAKVDALWQAFDVQNTKPEKLLQSKVLHAPYSISKELITALATDSKNQTLSIHNQECEAENTLYLKKEGALLQFLIGLGIDHSHFEASGFSSLISILPYLKTAKRLLFVHNTFTQEADILAVKEQLNNYYFCLCPKANLYIENRMPPVPLLIKHEMPLCLGTDSLASNDTLSILEEMKCIKNHYPDVSMEMLLQWACYNGACALGFEDQLGTLTIGKRPGLNWINNNFTLQKLL